MSTATVQCGGCDECGWFVGRFGDVGQMYRRYVRFSARAAAVAGDERELECLGSRTASAAASAKSAGAYNYKYKVCR